MYAIDGKTFLRSSSADAEIRGKIRREMRLKMILLKFVAGIQYWEA
jgi:hypothetical protein